MILDLLDDSESVQKWAFPLVDVKYLKVLAGFLFAQFLLIERVVLSEQEVLTFWTKEADNFQCSSGCVLPSSPGSTQACSYHRSSRVLDGA